METTESKDTESSEQQQADQAVDSNELNIDTC
jgi:hypothetical protein